MKIRYAVFTLHCPCSHSDERSLEFLSSYDTEEVAVAKVETLIGDEWRKGETCYILKQFSFE